MDSCSRNFDMVIGHANFYEYLYCQPTLIKVRHSQNSIALCQLVPEWRILVDFINTEMFSETVSSLCRIIIFLRFRRKWHKTPFIESLTYLPFYSKDLKILLVFMLFIFPLFILVFYKKLYFNFHWSHPVKWDGGKKQAIYLVLSSFSWSNLVFGEVTN